MSSKFAIENENVLQLLGDFAGLRPWTPLGDFRPPDPIDHLCSSKISFKKALHLTGEEQITFNTDSNFYNITAVDSFEF